MTNKIETIGLQLPSELAEELRVRAKANERSVSAEVRLAIRAHLEAGERAA